MKPIVYLFSASWCQPCKLIKPVFATIASDYEETFETQVVDVEAEETRPLVEKYKISVVPTIIMTTGVGEERIEGALPPVKLVRSIEDWIKAENL